MELVALCLAKSDPRGVCLANDSFRYSLATKNLVTCNSHAVLKDSVLVRDFLLCCHAIIVSACLAYATPLRLSPDRQLAAAGLEKSKSPSPHSHTEGVPSLERAVSRQEDGLRRKRTDSVPGSAGALSTEEPYLRMDWLHLGCVRERREASPCIHVFSISTNLAHATGCLSCALLAWHAISISTCLAHATAGRGFTFLRSTSEPRLGLSYPQVYPQAVD